MTKIIFFLYRNDNIFIKIMMAFVFFLFTIIATSSFKLGKHIFLETLYSNSKNAARRMVWYLKRSWIGWSPVSDPFFEAFDVTAEPSIHKAQIEILSKAKKSAPHSDWFTWDELLSEACQIHYKLKAKKLDDIEVSVNKYSKAAVEILNQDFKQLPIKFTRRETKDINHFQEKASQGLKQFAELCNKAKKKWFVIGGTFLGAIREGNFLEHDSDVDIGVFYEEKYPKELCKLLINSPHFTSVKYVTRCEITKKNDGSVQFDTVPAKIIAIHKSGLHFDVFIHHRISDKIVHGSSHTIWHNTQFELSNYQLGTMTVLGPENADLYLTEHYGNWKTEQKTYTCEADTYNVMYSNNFVSLSLHIIRALRLESEKNIASLSIKQKLVEQGFFSRSENGKFVSNLHDLISNV